MNIELTAKHKTHRKGAVIDVPFDEAHELLLAGHRPVHDDDHVPAPDLEWPVRIGRLNAAGAG